MKLDMFLEIEKWREKNGRNTEKHVKYYVFS